MRYFIRDTTLFLRGRFRAASTGINGGIADVTTILNHTVPRDFDDDPPRYLDLLTARHGLSREYFGLLTAVRMRHLCVLQYDFVTVFITAGVTNPTRSDPKTPHTINIIVYSREGMSDAALLETIVTVTGAKAQALHDLGYDFPGTTTDAVAVACDRDTASAHTYAGTLTEVGRRVHAAVLYGVPEALARQQGKAPSGANRRSSSTAATAGITGWSGKKRGALTTPATFRGSGAITVTVPTTPASMRNSGNGSRVQAAAGSGAVPDVRSCTSRRSQTT